jgi:zinc transporter ZupT
MTSSAALVIIGGILIAIATLAGAWLGRRPASRRDLCFAAAGGALLVIAGYHLVPDALAAAKQTGIGLWIVPLVAVGSYGVTGIAVRRGCVCAEDCQPSSGAGTAAALSAHRLLEGVVLGLAGSVMVAVALFVHAFAEGLAAGTLLSSVTRRRAALWLAAMCVSPLAGAALTSLAPIPARAEPILLAVAAGVLGQAAKVSLSAAFRNARQVSLAAMSQPAAATLIAAAVTTLAVRGVG